MVNPTYVKPVPTFIQISDAGDSSVGINPMVIDITANTNLDGWMTKEQKEEFRQALKKLVEEYLDPCGKVYITMDDKEREEWDEN